jgi:uncharacterized RDD family membrane protein YckC
MMAPGLWRRLAAFVYEGVVLFGVVMVAGFIFSIATDQRHALSGRTGLQAFMFVVLGLYFVWFWTHGGQTVAMKTWQIRVVDRSGQALTPARALLRYLLSWLWFAPALAVVALNQWHARLEISLALLIGIVAYALLGQVLPERQFLHDRLAGTRLQRHQPTKPARA